jgi:hypothetical protein
MLLPLKFLELISGIVLITLGGVLSTGPPDGDTIFAQAPMNRMKKQNQYF